MLKLVTNRKKMKKKQRKEAFRHCYLQYTKSQTKDLFAHPILKVSLEKGILIDRLRDFGGSNYFEQKIKRRKSS